jgi:hypothetical protein
MKLLAFAGAAVCLSTEAFAQPAVTQVSNSASYTQNGLPGYGIA